jgi:hypothetical protein
MPETHMITMLSISAGLLCVVPSTAFAHETAHHHRTHAAGCTVGHRSAAQHRCRATHRPVRHSVRLPVAKAPEGEGSVKAPTPTPAPAGNVLFDGTFPASGAPNGGTVQAGNPGSGLWGGPGTDYGTSSVTGTPDPLGSGQDVGKFTVVADASDLDPTYPNVPRADLESPELMSPTENSNVYISIPVYVPMSTVPAMYGSPSRGFLVDELFGPPYARSPAAGDVSATATSARAFRYSFTWRDVLNTYDGGQTSCASAGCDNTQWVSPTVTTDTWHTVILHLNWSASASTGYAELWYDGVPQEFTSTGYPLSPGAPPTTGTGGTDTRIYYSNFNSDNNGAPNFNNVALYGNDNATLPETLYHGESKIGTTLASVTPLLSPTGP